MTTRWARVVRGLVAAVFSLFVAAVSHLLSGGTQPSAFALIACLVLATFVCVALSGKKLSRLRLSLSVLVSQLLFHGIFSLWSSAPSAIETGHRLAHGQMTMELTSTVLPVDRMMPDDGAMWLGHAVAAIVTILALRHGEVAFWSLLDGARLWIGALLSRAPSAPGPLDTHPALSPAERVFLPRDLVLLLSPMRHRGPPAQGGHLVLA